MANSSVILDSSLKLMPHCRWLFFWIILIISVIAILANILAIISVITREKKCLKKVCIIGLSLSDIFSIIVFATNNLDTLGRELKTWELGEFLCHFIPMGQVLGTTASSIALLAIASDRYQCVTIAIVSQRWNPSLWKCLVTCFITIFLCSVSSYPMYLLFYYNPIQVVHTSGPEPIFEDTFCCVAIEKDKLRTYYTILSVMIFLPIVVMFIWFYYQIAALVWRHRKPFLFTTNTGTPQLILKKTKTAQVQRKIRTFKVIIVLMVSFVACRLPYWIFCIVKLLNTIQGSTIWYVHFSLTALNMLNSALNPFLYAFLNQTILFSRKCHEFVWKIALGCYCSEDFKKLHKNKPFVVNLEGQKDNTDKEHSCKIKFVDAAHLPTYIKIPPQKELLI